MRSFPETDIDPNSLGKDIKSTPFGDFKKQFKNELLCQY